MKHRGEIVLAKVKESGMKIQSLADRLNCSRTTLYTYFENPTLDLDLVINIGKIIGYDFSKDFPQLNPSMVMEDAVIYGASTLPECLKEKEEWKTKYYSLLEKYNSLLEGEIGKLFTRG